jgi:hypothetical protein
MRSKLLFLMLLALGIAVIGSSVRAADNVIVNPGFEDPLNAATNWETWGWGGFWAEVGSDPAIQLSGNYLACGGATVWAGGSGAFQMFDAEEGQFYAISAWAKTTDENSRATLVLVVFDDLTVGGTEETELYREELDMTGFNGNDGTWQALPEWTYGELQIQLLSENFTRADPTITGQLQIKVEVANNGGDGTTYFDDIAGYLGGLPGRMVTNPSPSDGEMSVSPSINTLSWETANNCADANSLVEVWWGSADDPNFWVQNPTKIMDLADVKSFNLSDAIGGPIVLESDKEYFWALKYQDPNGCLWGINELAKGPTWSFDTINRAPVVDAGLNISKWLPVVPSVKIGLDATVSDDVLPEGCPLTYEWGAVSGVTYIPSNDGGQTSNVQDPNVIITAAGDYLLTLTVDDGKTCNPAEYKETSDSILVRIFDNGDDRLQAHWPLDDAQGVAPVDVEGGHDGTLVGDPNQAESGQVGTAIWLDGAVDYITIGDTGTDPNVVEQTGGTHSWENQIEDGITVSAWMKLDADGWNDNWESLVGKGNHQWELLRAGADDGARFIVHGQSETSVFDSGATLVDSSTENFDVTSGWHQVVGTFDGNRVVLYVDGLEAGSADTEFDKIALSPAPITIGTTTNIGDDGSSTPWNEDRSEWDPDSYMFGGKLDEVRIYDAAVPHRAEYAATPGIVEQYRADGGHDSCGGVYLISDANKDCFVTLTDFAMIASTWLECSDIGNVYKDCD